jgi:carbon monoxide dehydrogenase subunit G
MTTTSMTRSIEIHAPVEAVFAFVSDPVKATEAVPWGHGKITVGDIRTAENGALTGYRYTGSMAVGPLHFQMHSDVKVTEYVPNRRYVEHSSGEVATLALESTGDGTRLTFTVAVSSRIPLMDKVKVLVGTEGRGQARNMDMVLAEIKKLVEAEAVKSRPTDSAALRP